MNHTSGGARAIGASGFRHRYIGDKKFYMAVLAIVVPVVIQNSISNFVNLLDNIMVGAVSTEQMSGVSIGNQLIFVFNLCVFGGVSGATIFGSQFFGAGDTKGVRDTFRYAVLISCVLAGVALAVFLMWSEPLLMLYINDAENLENVAATFQAGKAYLNVMLIGLVPFAVSQAYAGMLRATGETKLPMYASVASVLTNLALNYVLIFGHFGFPALQARGAAIATVASRFVELAIIVVVSHIRAHKTVGYAFLVGAYTRFHIPVKLLRAIFVKGMPLLVNEAFWSFGMATLSRQYSLRGLVVVAATNITNTLNNLFMMFVFSLGTAASVLIGQALGANDAIKARTYARWMLALEVFVCLCVGLVLFVVAPALPALYTSTGADVRALATNLLRVCACIAPFLGFAHCSYFILRSGGRTGITFLFDSAYTWLVPVPIAMLLVKYTQWEMLPIYICCNSAEIIKDVIGYILVKKGVWIRNIVS